MATFTPSPSRTPVPPAPTLELGDCLDALRALDLNPRLVTVVTHSTPGGPLVTHAGHPRAVSWAEGERIGAALVARILAARQVAA